MTNTIIIADGEFSWAADAESVRDAFASLGWGVARNDYSLRVTEGEGGYEALIDAVRLVSDEPVEYDHDEQEYVGHPEADVLEVEGGAWMLYAQTPAAWLPGAGQRACSRVYRVEDGGVTDVSDDPQAQPVDGMESVLVVAADAAAALSVAQKVDAGKVEPDNVPWRGQVIVAARVAD